MNTYIPRRDNYSLQIPENNRLPFGIYFRANYRQSCSSIREYIECRAFAGKNEACSTQNITVAMFVATVKDAFRFTFEYKAYRLCTIVSSFRRHSSLLTTT